jgi:hypothetical protein
MDGWIREMGSPELESDPGRAAQDRVWAAGIETESTLRVWWNDESSTDFDHLEED